MNPAALRFNIIPVLVGLFGLLIALILGMFIGGGEIINLALIFGALIVVLTLAGMRQHIWLLIPLFWGFTGSVYILPIPFAVRDLAVMFTAAAGFALLALRIYRFRNKWGAVDFLVFLNLVPVILAFIANPVGLRALSSETVGARPYFNTVIGLFAYLIVSNQLILPNLARKLPIFIFIPEAITSAITLFIRAVPSSGYVLGWIYSGFLPPTGTEAKVERISVGSGNTLILILCSYFRPLTLLMPVKPGRLFLFLVAIVLILISGFRNQLITAIAIFCLASYFRKGFTDLLPVLVGLTVAFVAVVLINAIYPLPLGMQRTLTFLPGKWDSRAVKDAENSTEWRLQMWKDIPKSGRYIRNPVMGDGFGFSRAELQAMQREHYRTGDMSQEDFMIIGSFHNGPLSAIRFVGVVGLIIYYLLLIYTAIYAARLIRRAENSDFYPLALFVGLPLIWEPWNYTLVFGAYDAALPTAIFSVGMLKAISNSMAAQQQSVKRKAAPSAGETRRAEAIHS